MIKSTFLSIIGIASVSSISFASEDKSVIYLQCQGSEYSSGGGQESDQSRPWSQIFKIDLLRREIKTWNEGVHAYNDTVLSDVVVTEKLIQGGGEEPINDGKTIFSTALQISRMNGELFQASTYKIEGVQVNYIYVGTCDLADDPEERPRKF